MNKKVPQYIILYLCVVIFNFTSCEKIKNCPECFTPPESLNMKITDSITGEDLIFNNLISSDSIEFYYFQNNEKEIMEHEMYIDSVNLKVILTCHELGWLSGDGIKDFYLYLGNNDVDTIFLDVEYGHTECCTYYQWLDFTINGNEMDIDTADFLYNYRKIIQ